MPPYLLRLFKSLYRELGWNDNHIEKLVEQKMTDDIDFFWFISFPMVILQEPFCSSKSFFGSMHSQLSLPAPNQGAHVLRYVALFTMMHPGNGHFHWNSSVTTNIDIAKFFSKRILRHGNKRINLVHHLLLFK